MDEVKDSLKTGKVFYKCFFFDSRLWSFVKVAGIFFLPKAKGLGLVSISPCGSALSLLSLAMLLSHHFQLPLVGQSCQLHCGTGVTVHREHFTVRF